VLWWDGCPSAYNLPRQNLPCVADAANSYNTTSASRSRHPGGVQCVLGDGSVRFVRDSINLPTWRAAATIAGGEVLGSDW